jgi:hypothetical protein
MNAQIAEASPLRLARLAGFLYLLVVPLGNGARVPNCYYANLLDKLKKT